MPLSTDNILYRGAKISKEEINKIKSYIKKKVKNLPGAIVFSKSFLSFSKSDEVAKKFLNKGSINTNLSKVLFILKKNDNERYNLSTHGDIENISYFPKEREVLFFPFSTFEIKNIKEIKINEEKVYEINLLYLGKYLNEFENNKNIIKKENQIPDSEFKKHLFEYGLVKKEKIEKITTKKLYEEFIQYSIDIGEYKKRENIIIGKIHITPNDINKEVNIINSFENIKKITESKIQTNSLDGENEEEVKENIEIKINNKKINFSYHYNFEKEGKY